MLHLSFSRVSANVTTTNSCPQPSPPPLYHAIHLCHPDRSPSALRREGEWKDPEDANDLYCRCREFSHEKIKGRVKGSLFTQYNPAPEARNELAQRGSAG